MVASEPRFEFGANWSRFLRMLDDGRISLAEQSIRELLDVETLRGRSFLDVGSGSGLFSLAARRLGARVFSFDYDPQSVACTRELRRRYCPDDPEWSVEQGSALDVGYLDKLGRFDVVYSWGVLHHTGAMWQALDRIDRCVADGGTLALALYADQGARSRFWWWVKRIFIALPAPFRIPWAVSIAAPFEVRLFYKWTRQGDFERWWKSWTNYRTARGMSRWHDMLDWMGGFPYEVAKPADIERFYRARGYELGKVHPTGGAGCIEYVLTASGRDGATAGSAG
jgi:SAM-dependent methyltransferase